MNHSPAPSTATAQDVLEAVALDHTPERSGVHLAGYPFRIAPPRPAAAGRPTPGSEWSVGDTLRVLRLRGASLVATDQGVRLARGRRAPAALARAVEKHAPALRLALRLGVLDYSVPAPWVAGDWDDATRLHAAWFGRLFSPPGPVELGPGRHVADFSKFRAAVAVQLAAGPAAPGAERLAADLASLYARFAPAPARVHLLPPARAMAA